MKVIYKTDVGKYREVNEDSHRTLENKKGDFLAVVADGMGGHNAGEVASKMAVDGIVKFFEEASYDNVRDFLKKSIAKVNNTVYTESMLNEEYNNMGTTLSILITSGDKIHIGHVGDSRIYYFNKEKHRIKKLTTDHTVVEALYKQGEITKEEKELHPYKNVLLQSLGTSKKIVADIKSILLPKGGYLLICSDGLTDGVTDEELYEEIISDKELDQKGDTLMDKALKIGKDNITFIVIQR